MRGSLIDRFIERLASEPAVLVSVDSTQGSAPREAGAWMAVFGKADPVGTVGGGHLEFEAIALARGALAGQTLEPTRRFALGPTLGQCCGGVVHLRFELLRPAQAGDVRARLESEADAARMPVALFGGGHVGRAIVDALLPLPARVHWIDSRDEVFPEGLPPWVLTEHSAPVHAAVADLAPQSRVLVMSFSHAEDLDIVAACLQRQRERGDLPFIGLIGSRSKWASFRTRLQARGFGPTDLARITCPIGVAGVVGKEPEAIAAAVAAQLMQQRGPAVLEAGARAAPVPVPVLRAHRVGDIGWIAHRQGLLYAQEYGWDASFEALVAEIAARFVRRFDAERERCWVAEQEGHTVGAVFLVRKSLRVAQLRLLYVEPAVRGQGVGRRLIAECIGFARQAGYRSITLWTNDGLDAARHLYQVAGFELVSQQPHQSFGKSLVGQHWTLRL